VNQETADGTTYFLEFSPFFIKAKIKRSMGRIDKLFDDKRVLCIMIACWTLVVTIIFVCIMVDDQSPFLAFGPNSRTTLFGFKLDTWTKWGCVAIYTFISTCIADFTSDSVGPWITNTIQDHKNAYLPYTKMTCITIVQMFAIYAIIMNTISLFVALSQVDFMLLRMLADLIVNYYTTSRFMQFKTVNPELYHAYLHSRTDPCKSEEHMFVVINPAPATVPTSDSMDGDIHQPRDVEMQNSHSHYETGTDGREGEERGLLFS